MTDTVRYVKMPIEELLNRPEYQRVFEPAGATPREYPLLREGGHPFAADFAYRLRGNGGWLFIEDDNAATAVRNLAKYWLWIEENAVRERVCLIHLIGPREPGQVALCRFVSEKLGEVQPFEYWPLRVQDWHEPKIWLPFLEQALRKVLEYHAVEPSEKAIGSLRNEAAIGMWKDREEMRDSSAWVRDLRRREWQPG